LGSGGLAFGRLIAGNLVIAGLAGHALLAAGSCCWVG